MTPIPFIGPAYQSRSDNYSSQRCVNWMLEPGKGKAPAMLVNTPGLTSPWITLTGTGCRGSLVLDDDTSVWVCGGNVYKVSRGAASTKIGDVPDDSRPVYMAAKYIATVDVVTSAGWKVYIAAGGNLYVVQTTGTSSTLVRSNVNSVDLVGNYIVYTKTGSNYFGYIDATKLIAEAGENETNSKTDIMRGLRVTKRTIYIFGSQSIEPWYTTQNDDFPFDRIDGGVFEIGCVAPSSIAELDTVFWLGGNDQGAGSVWMTEGGAPKKISTPAIEFAISQWPDITDGEAFTYTQEGHAFYVLSSQSGNETFVYDVSTQEWHQRAWLHPSGALHRIRPRTHIYFAGKHLVGDWENGNVYQYDLNTYTDNGDPMPSIRACQTIQQGLEVQRNMSFRLDMDTGVGLTTGQGSDPQAMLRWSKDGGKTWSNALWRSFGKIGEYGRRCWWHRVGGGERMVYEVQITDPVPRNVTGAFVG